MKQYAHIAFSFGLLTFILRPLGLFESLSFAFLFAVVVNYVIDAGHVRSYSRYAGKVIPKRSWITHSVVIAPLWGALLGLAFSLPLDAFFRVNLLFVMIGAGIIAAYSHLLLDSVTEGGVFLLKRRIALAHYRYNNVAANIMAAIFGMMLFYAAVFLAF
jgi:hypothetical protein